MTALDTVLARLEKVREVQPGRWRARCPGHGGRNPTALAITTGDDGHVLLHCFHGCEVERVASALGLQLHELMPRRAVMARGPMLQPFMPAQVFDVVRHEALVVSVIGSDMRRDRAISDVDYARLGVAVQRLDDVAARAYGRNRH